MARTLVVDDNGYGKMEADWAGDHKLLRVPGSPTRVGQEALDLVAHEKAIQSVPLDLHCYQPVERRSAPVLNSRPGHSGELRR